MDSFLKAAFALTLVCVLRLPLGALDLPSAAIEDDSTLRISIRDEWFRDTEDRIMAKEAGIQTLPGGGRLQIRAERSAGEFAVILARELTGPGGQGMGTFPGWAQGSWVYVRSRADGSPLRIRVFLRSDRSTYIQFRPLDGARSQMDLVVYDAYISRSQPVAVSFERLLSMPLETVYALMGENFKRRYFDPDPENYRDSLLFMSRLRRKLPELAFRDDGAVDARGAYVFIETLKAQDGKGGLNCSGFVKWVVDGILRPITGRRLDIPALKAPFGQRGSSYTAIWEDVRDPFFGLDWTRNLAAQAWTTLRSSAYAVPEEFEVRDWPFTQLIYRSESAAAVPVPDSLMPGVRVPSPVPAPALKDYPGYLENSGFGVEGLQPLLYTLAIDEPGYIYLASVNDEIGPPATADNPRGLPRLRQHFHVAVLVPYFDRYGGFQIAVFESAEETRFSRFRARYPGHNVNLVRIPVEGAFDP
ncbi:MAG: hypothetical protein LBI94_09955 [Treponema sp.]|jgi:hypothetical protein|nr:hypothetical protein [Treponema sp.]